MEIVYPLRQRWGEGEMDRKILKGDTSKQKWYCLLSLQQLWNLRLDLYLLCTGHSTSNATYKKCCIKEEKKPKKMKQ